MSSIRWIDFTFMNKAKITKDVHRHFHYFSASLPNLIIPLHVLHVALNIKIIAGIFLHIHSQIGHFKVELCSVILYVCDRSIKFTIPFSPMYLQV